MDYNDYELIYMIRENEEAFDYLLEKYEPLLKRIASSFVLKYQNRNIEYDDILQQCRITLFNAVKQYDIDKEVLFYSYLLSSINKSVLKYIRSNRYKNNDYKYKDIQDINSVDVSSGYDPLHNYIDYEYEQEIIAFKNSLNILEASVFELRYNGFSYKDIAILLDISIKKVDNILVKLRKKLEKYFLFS